MAPMRDRGHAKKYRDRREPVHLVGVAYGRAARHNLQSRTEPCPYVARIFRVARERTGTNTARHQNTSTRHVVGRRMPTPNQVSHAQQALKPRSREISSLPFRIDQRINASLCGSAK